MEMLKRAGRAAWLDRHTIIKFGVVGCTASGANLFSMFALTHWAGLWYLASSVIAFAVGVLISFLFQKFWTFRDHSTDGVHMQALWFVMAALAGVAVNATAVYALVEWAAIHYLLAQIIGSGGVAVANFFIYRRLFRAPLAEAAPAHINE